MPRPAPAEKLYPYHLRLTAAQIAKVTSCGGAAWVRGLITKAQASTTGRDPKAYRQSIASRNFAIGISTKTTLELAALYRLSPQRINQIRRQHEIDRQIDVHLSGVKGVQLKPDAPAPGRARVDDDAAPRTRWVPVRN